MAHKRKLVVEKEQPQAPPEEESLNWRDWLLRRYARYWYWLAMLFLDMVIFFELQRSLGANALVAGMAAVGAGAIQFAIYFRVWGRGSPLGDQGNNEKE
jgi:hypothetical protein